MKNKRFLIFLILTLLMLQPINSIGLNENKQVRFSSKSELKAHLSKFKTRETIVNETLPLYTLDRSPSSKAMSDSAETNVQVNGVDEGEILKNYENHIYYADNGKINIISANQGKLSLVSEIKGSNLNYQELYVIKNKLVAISDFYNQTNQKVETLVQIYDTSDLKKPQLYREVSIEGSLLQSRMVGEQLYIISNKYLPYFRTIDDMMPSLLRDSKDPTVKEIPTTSIAYYPNIYPESYTNILSMNVNGKDKINIESVLGDSQSIYMNDKNLYLTSADYNNEVPLTLISKYKLDNQNLTFLKTTSVKGTLLNQFSMDEYKDSFRLATTINIWSNSENKSSNSLFILDKNMNISGKIENIAPGENIKSVRFQEDKGYIVTFREIDPLFTLDLSSTTNPKVLGQLKVPGYSSYMHVLPDNMVLGIGRDIQDMYVKNKEGKQINVGAREGGIKLSIFDVSNPLNPKEKDSMILGGAGSYSDAISNHKALMVNASKNDFGLCVRLTSDMDNSHTFNGAVIINTSKGILTQKGTITGTDPDNHYNNNPRLTYIGNYLYYVTSNSVSSYKYDTFTQISNLNIK